MISLGEIYVLTGMDRGAIADGQLELRVEPVAKDQKCKK
jgi:hypothetical protein